MSVRARFGLVVAIALVSGAVGVPTPAAATSPRLHYENAVAVHAPEGRKGGLMTPGVWCSNPSVNPRTRVVIESLGTGETWRYRWRGVLPGYGFPRVDLGQYEVRTRGTCGQRTRNWTETLRVREKTVERTVSRPEWRRIRRGMSTDRVAKIIGYDGKFAGRWRGKRMRQYDMMPFWRWSIVEYRDGRVVSKHWNVGHD